jgi:hypothetical protein
MLRYYVPLFNFNVIFVWQKKTHAQLFEFYLLRDIKHVVWHSAYCYIVPSITPDHRLNVEQLYLLHKGGLHTSEKLAAYE